MPRREVIYFDKPGSENTDETLRAARARLEELEIRYMVVASTRGYTAFKALDLLGDLKDRVSLIVVTHAGAVEYKAEDLERLRSSWAKILTCPHTLGWTVGDSFRSRYGGGFTAERIVADAFRRFSEGMKVAVEIVLMATDAGLTPPGVDVVSVAGTGSGADTAIVVTSAYSREFFKLKVREVIAMPR
ncbi:MAG: pyruvate kinase alpha/beta domain-containing protein [Candidatus Bathyarchaeia archaeon]